MRIGLVFILLIVALILTSLGVLQGVRWAAIWPIFLLAAGIWVIVRPHNHKTQ